MPRRWFQTLICVGLFWAIFPANAEIPSGVIKQSLGRDFGIFTGDVIRHNFIVQVPVGYQISEASLPVPGDLSYWLVLQDVIVKPLDANEARQLFQVTLHYQTFYAPLDVRALQIPVQSLQAHLKGESQINITLPDWEFTMSPLKEIAQRGVGRSETTSTFMKPALPPIHHPSQHQKNWVFGLAVSVVFLALFWAYLHGWIWRRQQSPFQQASRKIKHLQARNANDSSASYAAIESVHNAFNQVAGHVLFAHQLPIFLENHPSFARYTSDIYDFFQQSDAVMFGQHTEMQPSLKVLRQLTRRLSRAETLGRTKP